MLQQVPGTSGHMCGGSTAPHELPNQPECSKQQSSAASNPTGSVKTTHSSQDVLNELLRGSHQERAVRERIKNLLEGGDEVTNAKRSFGHYLTSMMDLIPNEKFIEYKKVVSDITDHYVVMPSSTSAGRDKPGLGRGQQKQHEVQHRFRRMSPIITSSTPLGDYDDDDDGDDEQDSPVLLSNYDVQKRPGTMTQNRYNDAAMDLRSQKFGGVGSAVGASGAFTQPSASLGSVPVVTTSAPEFANSGPTYTQLTTVQPGMVNIAHPSQWANPGPPPPSAVQVDLQPISAPSFDVVFDDQYDFTPLVGNRQQNGKDGQQPGCSGDL